MNRYIVFYGASSLNFSGTSVVTAKNVDHARVLAKRLGRSYLYAGYKHLLDHASVESMYIR